MKPDDVANLLPIVVLVVLAYVLLIRPARKRARDAATLQEALSAGDQIMLTSGIFGRVVNIDGESVHVEIAPGVVLTAHRGAVGKIVADIPADTAAASNDDHTPKTETVTEAQDGHDDNNSTRGTI